MAITRNVWRRTPTTATKAIKKSEIPIASKEMKKARAPSASNAFKKVESCSKIDIVCKFWVSGSCLHGDQCRYRHSWYLNSDGNFSMIARLSGHKDITGFCLPEGSDKLFTGCRDGTVQVWDCNSGECVRVFNLEEEIGSMLCEGSWIFVGLPNLIQVWHGDEVYRLDGPVGQVYAFEFVGETLFAGTQNGDVLAWRTDLSSTGSSNPFELIATLKGHTMPVTCLRVGGDGLYSGSMDRTVRVWHLKTLQCVNILNGYSDTITSLLCWECYLLTSSLDKTIKIWAETEEGTGKLEVIYTHSEEHGIVTLGGMHDRNNRPVLFSSCKDNSVRLYDLPSFMERGMLFGKNQVQLIRHVPQEHIFFTVDGSGTVAVWKWLSDQPFQ